MRSLALATLLTAACACVSATGSRSRAAPRPVIVVVHGRGQFGRDTAVLRREWERDLDSALALVGAARLRPGDVRLAWYADALDPDSTYRCAPRPATADMASFDLRDIASGFLNFLASAVGDSQTDELRALVGETMYVLDRRTRCAAEARVASVIRAAQREQRPVIVVAYSLGSLVSYGYLLHADSATRVRLITVGSPLALRPVREIIFGGSLTGESALPVPRAVVSWDNVYDASDVLAGPLSGQLPADVLRDHATHASSANDAHLISRYLRDRATGEALQRALGTPR